MNPSWLSAPKQFDRLLTRWIEADRNRTTFLMTTPSAIERITAHAERAGALMKTTDTTDQLAGPILDAYETSLKRFQAGLSDIDQKRKALDAVLPAFGNAAAALDAAFQGQKPAEGGASVNGEQAPHPMPPSSPNP